MPPQAPNKMYTQWIWLMLCLAVNAAISVAMYVLFSSIYITIWSRMGPFVSDVSCIRASKTRPYQTHPASHQPKCCSLEEHNISQNQMVVFFSPNCASQLQPLHMGIIRAFMCNYRKRFISQTVTWYMENCCRMFHVKSWMCCLVGISQQKPRRW